MTITISYGGYGSDRIKAGTYRFTVNPWESERGVSKGSFKDPKTGRVIYRYYWRRKYKFPILMAHNKKLYHNRSTEESKIADIEIAKLLLIAYEQGKKSYALRSKNQIVKTHEQIKSITEDLRFAPYPKEKGGRKITGTPLWFTSKYKMYSPCYKRTEDGTSYELVNGKKIWLYDRRTRLSSDPILLEKGKRILHEGLNPWCNKCKYTEFCQTPCIDIQSIVGKECS